MEGLIVQSDYRKDVLQVVVDTENRLNTILGFPVKVTLEILPKEITDTVIQAVICKEMGVEWDDVVGKCRKRELVHARQVYCSLTRDFIKKKLISIAKDVNYYDHSDVLHSIKTLKDLLETCYQPLTTQYNNILRNLLNAPKA